MLYTILTNLFGGYIYQIINYLVLAVQAGHFIHKTHNIKSEMWHFSSNEG